MKTKIKLIDKEEIAEETYAFKFEKPVGFDFRAGQYCDLTLIDPPETDEEGNIRSFSIASSPKEEKLIFATRMRVSSFKRFLKDCSLGTEVKLEGPLGSFTLHGDSSKTAVFLIGGIGITPVRSIILNALETRSNHKLFLFYSNRRPEDSAFLEELSRHSAQNKNFKFVPTMTDMEHSAKKWDGETGYITSKMLNRYTLNPHEAIYYISGPESMVQAMRKLAVDEGINEDNIKTEEFSGY